MGNSMTSSTHEKDIHRVLGTKITGPFPENLAYVILATGCFWGSEKSFWRLPGVYTTAVGYSGGKAKKATYNEVCSGTTGHTESVLVVWDPAKLSIVDIVRMFLQCHNPTQVNGQGNDTGTQYRSAFYFNTDDQKRIGLAAIKSYEKSLGNRKIATEVKQVGMESFIYAEDYHQQYLASPGARKYCSAQPQEVNMEDAKNWVPEDLYTTYAPKLDDKFWAKHAPTFHCVLREPDEQITEW